MEIWKKMWVGVFSEHSVCSADARHAVGINKGDLVTYLPIVDR